MWLRYALLLSAVVKVIAATSTSSTNKTVALALALEVPQPGWLAELSSKQYRVDGQVWHALRCQGLMERLQCPSLPQCHRGFLYYGDTSRTFATTVPLHAPPASALWEDGDTRLGVPFLTLAVTLPSSWMDWVTIVAPPAAFCLAKAVAGRRHVATKPRVD